MCRMNSCILDLKIPRKKEKSQLCTFVARGAESERGRIEPKSGGGGSVRVSVPILDSEGFGVCLE